MLGAFTTFDSHQHTLAVIPKSYSQNVKKLHQTMTRKNVGILLQRTKTADMCDISNPRIHHRLAHLYPIAGDHVDERIETPLFLPLLTLIMAFFRSHRYPFLGGIPRGGAKSPQPPSDSPTNRSPLWPNGINDRDVEDLVQACLRDKSINLPSVPDVLEHQIYRSTIKLTLNAIYKALNGIHGQTILGHAAFTVTRQSRKKWKIQDDLEVLKRGAPASEKVLVKVAEQLLQNPLVNQPLIPDVLERKLYVNCLKIVFRVLDLLTSTFRLTLCGHQVQIQLEPTDSSFSNFFESSALHRASDKTPLVEFSHMREWALDQERSSTSRRWFWQRWLFSPFHNEFIAQLHASLYCLVLGILDDFLESTEIQILSDRIQLDLVPLQEQPDPWQPYPTSDAAQANKADSIQSQHYPLRLLLAFSLGVAGGFFVRDQGWTNLFNRGS